MQILCRKTSLLRCLCGFNRPTSGTIEINGKLVFTEDVFVPPEQRNVGMVFQDYALFPTLNVTENIACGLAIYDASRVEELLLQTGLKEHQHKKVISQQ